jgi:hypothetical protein
VEIREHIGWFLHTKINMSVNINSFKVFVQAVQNKVQSGNSVTVAQFNAFCHQAQMMVFEKDRHIFIKTGDMSDFLSWFLINAVLNPNINTGYLAYPSDYQHTAGVRSYYNGKERPVELVENKAWGEVIASELMAPSKLFPKYTEFANEYRFLPRDIGIVMLDYWREPVKPIWAFTIVNNKEVYNPTGSVDFEWGAFALNEVAAVYLQLVGCNIKDKELSAFANQFSQESNAIL